MLNKWVLLGVALAMVFGSLSCGPGPEGRTRASISGTYMNRDNPDEYLELRADGTFYLKEIEAGFVGEWDIKGDVLTLSFPLGLAARGRVEGDTVVDEEGKTWVKKEEKPITRIAPVRSPVVIERHVVVTQEPQIIEVVKEVPVEKVVKETVIVEKVIKATPMVIEVMKEVPVEKVVEKEVIKEVPVVVTATPAPPTATPTCRPIVVDPQLSGAWDQGKFGCPMAQANVIWAAWQPFERGHMLWPSDTQRVIAFHDDGIWTEFADQWAEGTPIPSRGTPPPGRVAPVRGFGYLWGTYDEVAERLGWALEEEKGLCINIQRFEQGFIFHSSDVPCTDEFNWATSPDFAPLFIAVHGDGTWRRHK